MGRRSCCCTAFPDSGRLWRHQVPALAEAGFQVIAPDLRGYGRSGKPEAIEAYSLLPWPGMSWRSWPSSRRPEPMW